MTTKEEVVRNRKKLYPAPKPAISREAFRNGYMRLKMAEKRLCQVQESAQYDSMAPDDGEGQHFQASGHPSAGVNSAGYEDGAEPMDTDENGKAANLEEQREAQREAEARAQLEKEEQRQERQTQKMRDKEQRKDERQKQQDAEWEQKEQERQQALEAKELAERELEERSKQQSEQLASVKAKLDSLKAQKQEMVEKLKQVLLTEDTEKERLAKLAALEEGEMLLDSPMPGSSTPACPHSSLPHQQGRPAWPQKSPALSSGVSHGSQVPSPALSGANPMSPLLYTRPGGLAPGAQHSGRAQMSIRGPDPTSPHSNLPPHLQSPHT